MAWETALTPWLAPFLDVLGDPRRRPWLPIYVRGLLSPSERKSLTPMATHIATHAAHDTTARQTHYHNLQQFITYSEWDVAQVLRLLAQRADALLGGPDAVLIVDDTALRKKGYTSLQALVAASRNRWVCEQAHLQLKQELGLDHFEGRSWRGLEHHTTLTMLSFAFLQPLRLQQTRSRKKTPCGGRARRRHRHARRSGVSSLPDSPQSC